MPITVNGYEITDADVERELPFHEEASNALKAATEALVLRRVLLDAAQEAGLPATSQSEEDAAIERLLAQEVHFPKPDHEACLRYYDMHPERFVRGELVEASHILFQVTQNTPLPALRDKAASILQRVLEDPAAFEQCACDFSNCPSGEMGGQLGQISRGQTVPEFEHVLFALEAYTIAPQLVETRFGLHIVRAGHKVEGKLLPFPMVEESIARFLADYAETKATQQYLATLVGQADIQGIEMKGAVGALLQ